MSWCVVDFIPVVVVVVVVDFIPEPLGFGAVLHSRQNFNTFIIQAVIF